MRHATALLTALFALAPVRAGEVAAPARALEPAKVDAALTALRADPDLGSDYRMKVLRWAHRSDDPDESTNGLWQRLQRWLAGLWSIAAAGTRWLILGIAAAAVAALCIWLVRLVLARQRASAPLTPAAPTHVLGMDIRPESLPADVGAAALTLWNRGERRAALALLYRGLLSRMLHGFAVPITDSSTEGECLTLAAHTMPVAPLAYARRLITTWQRAVYASHPPADDELGSLCESFDTYLPPPRAIPGVAQ